jgi:hypothetical protein
MCISPNNIDGIEVACRECWQCRKDKVSDYIGKCIAEQQMATRTLAVTLTYADARKRFEKDYVRLGWDGEYPPNELLERMYPDAKHAAKLVYADFQKFLKRLRKRYNHKVRYMVVGEYGSAKGRAHWHAILFIYGNEETIDKELEEMGVKYDIRTSFRPWEQGYSYFQKPDWKGFQYLLKYVLKDQAQRVKRTHLACTKGYYRDGEIIEGPLGHDWFQKLAEDHVKQGIVPRSYIYKFHDVRNAKGKIKKFKMVGATRRNFMETFINKWNQKYGKDPYNELVQEYLDKNTTNEMREYDIVNKYENGQIKEITPIQRKYFDDSVKYITPWEENNEQGKYANAEIITGYIEGKQFAAFVYEETAHMNIGVDEWRDVGTETVKRAIKEAYKVKRRAYYDVVRDIINDEARDEQPKLSEQQRKEQHEALIGELKSIQASLL